MNKRDWGRTGYPHRLAFILTQDKQKARQPQQTYGLIFSLLLMLISQNLNFNLKFRIDFCGFSSKFIFQSFLLDR
jgi:hypothetical protein